MRAAQASSPMIKEFYQTQSPAIVDHDPVPPHVAEEVRKSNSEKELQLLSTPERRDTAFVILFTEDGLVPIVKRFLKYEFKKLLDEMKKQGLPDTDIHPEHPILTNYWALPGGGVEQGEEAYQAAMHEFEEETGARLAAIEGLAFKMSNPSKKATPDSQSSVFFAYGTSLGKISNLAGYSEGHADLILVTPQTAANFLLDSGRISQEIYDVLSQITVGQAQEMVRQAMAIKAANVREEQIFVLHPNESLIPNLRL
jgi:8-oxo-dGTP pyrophosphatase MutT (NUDIX family)